MKAPRFNSENGGFTLVEVLLIILVIVVLAAMIPVPSRTTRIRAYLVACMSNQKQTGIALTMFYQDNGNKYPWELSTTNGGSMEKIPLNQVFPHFQSISKYINKRTDLFVCPSDTSRHEAINIAQLADTNLSYFLNFNATVTPQSILTGDRHLQADGKAIGSGSFAYSTNMDLSWTRELHTKNGPIGAASFGDGHVQAIKAKDLNQYFRNQPAATNHMVIP